MSDSSEVTLETAVEQQSSAEEQTTHQTTTDDVTAEDTAKAKNEPAEFDAGEKKPEASKGNDAVKEGEDKPKSTTKTDTNSEAKDKDKSIEAKEGEVLAKEEEPVVPKQPRKMYCLDPTDTVDIAIGESGIRALKPMTIPQFIKRTVDKIPDGKALCWKDNKEASWQSLTYTEYLKLIYNTAKSFLKVLTILLYAMCVCIVMQLGLEPYHSVGILGFNSVEWFASSLGAVFAGYAHEFIVLFYPKPLQSNAIWLLQYTTLDYRGCSVHVTCILYINRLHALEIQESMYKVFCMHIRLTTATTACMHDCTI